MKSLLICAAACGLLTSARAQQDPDMMKGSLASQYGIRGPISARTAIGKGDLLTIIVNESVSGNFNASTTTTKKDTSSTSASSIPLLNFATGPLLSKIIGKSSSIVSQLTDALTGANSTGANSSIAGSGTTTNASNFAAKIAVVVTGVSPQGNLTVEGQRWLKVNKEMQSVIFTGIVRRDDVQLDNTVSSEKVANARLEAEGKGAIAERQRKGLLNQILDWLF